MYSERLKLDSPSDLRESLRRAMRDGGVPARVADDVLLATQEACNNALRHGEGAGGCEIWVSFPRTAVVVEVGDRGAGFDLDEVVRQWPPSPTATGGRGLYIISHLTDSLEVVRRERGTLVRMVKRL